MYSENELESAVASGTLSREAADALRGHVANIRQTPSADEEQFRLITSFNDIFVAIAGTLVLVGAGWLGGGIWPPLGGLAVAAAAWAMAEFFTRQRRMAFPSIVFFIAFVGGVYAFGMFGILSSLGITGVSLFSGTSRNFLIAQSVGAALVVGASWLHWRRFMVPIAVAAGVAAIARLLFTLIAAAAYPDVGQWMLFLVLAGGLTIFAYAMWWDMSDRDRKTRKSDVAFWLHLAASPMIVHPIFVLLGVNIGISEGNSVVIAVLAIVIYAALAVVALIVDRRAILVSALVYVLAAAIYLVSKIGSSGLSFALAIIIIGSSLLMLSAFWQTMRKQILPLLPDSLGNRMPVVG
ncbi:hypothetical protein [Sphingomonas sp.]|uniref:hypothetical protein n=1 Tax=Sphingomonas sp. TaxID=28214 RepID=UPI0025D96E6F|nr:hypothetical protein [Sphingomonas sp.]